MDNKLEPLGPVDTVIVIDNEEHRVLGYSCRGSYVRLMRAIGWEITVAVKYCQNNKGTLAEWTFAGFAEMRGDRS